MVYQIAVDGAIIKHDFVTESMAINAATVMQEAFIRKGLVARITVEKISR